MYFRKTWRADTTLFGSRVPPEKGYGPQTETEEARNLDGLLPGTGTGPDPRGLDFRFHVGTLVSTGKEGQEPWRRQTPVLSHHHSLVRTLRGETGLSDGPVPTLDSLFPLRLGVEVGRSLIEVRRTLGSLHREGLSLEDLS